MNSESKQKPRKLIWLLAFLAIAILVTAGVMWNNSQSIKTDFEKSWTGAAAKDFNVVVITLDTTRADHIGCYGYRGASTPVLDGMASEGIRFTDAVTCVPMTLPAHASLFTGLNPPNHGIRANGIYTLDEDYNTLAETLGRHGYETAAFISAFVLDARYGVDQGFDHYDDEVSPARGSHVVQRNGGAVTSAALKWLKNREQDKPFFLWVHYFDPHLSYDPPEPYATRFKSNPYDGEIAYMDNQLGRLLKQLSRDGGDKNTLVLVVGDHGESLGEHSELEHSRTIYEATQHVPLILWAPGIDQQAYVVDDAVVGIIDLYPTVIDLLGLEEPTDSLDGISLLNCREPKDRALYMETMRTYLDHQWAPLFGLRRLNDKYILAPRAEYYDLPDDPGEINNLYPEMSNNESVTQLAEALSKRIKRDPLEEAAAAAAAAVTPDDEALRRLQSLGYVSGTDGGELELPPDPKDMMPVLEQVFAAKKFRHDGQFQKALEVALEANDESPNDRTVLRELGTIYAKLGNAEESEKMFSRYLKIKPDADVCWSLAQIVMQTGRPEKAKELLQQALKLEPEHGGAMLTSGDLAVLEKNYDEAMRLYEQAREVDPYRVKKMADAKIENLRKRMENQQ